MEWLFMSRNKLFWKGMQSNVTICHWKEIGSKYSS